MRRLRGGAQDPRTEHDSCPGKQQSQLYLGRDTARRAENLQGSDLFLIGYCCSRPGRYDRQYDVRRPLAIEIERVTRHLAREPGAFGRAGVGIDVEVRKI